MKTFLLLFAILAATTCDAQHSNTTPTDTLCLPAQTVRNLVTGAEQGKLLKERVSILQANIDLLSKQEANYEAQLKKFQQIDSLGSVEIRILQSQLQITAEQRALFEAQVSDLRAEVKKWRRKTRWTAIGGGVLAVGVFVLAK